MSRTKVLPLNWFPKKFDAGAIDGEGAKKLLGTPAVEPAAVLVREMAQNSWDARGTAAEISFILNLRRLDAEIVDVLRHHVFTADATGTGIRELLDKDEVWALEVIDRGTVGLGGPVRNDLAVPDGVSTNFIDLVFNIGSTKSDPHSGGNYGFGKTISYSISEVGAVLIWSRCRTDEGVQDRLIGSAIGEAFDRDGKRHTGRHWWGRVPTRDRVEPVVDDDAAELGGLVFSRGFQANETGTSQLILQPRLGGATAKQNTDLLLRAVLWNLWPKLLQDQQERPRMRIQLQVDGVDQAIPAIEEHPVLSGHADCLRAVRAMQGDMAHPSTSWNVDVQEIWLGKPKKLLGHLALTKYPADDRALAAAELEPSRGVTLMRHEAELVVKTQLGPRHSTPGFQWAGVFKPINDVDASFAAAEPPAHDDWSTAHIRDAVAKRDVNVAFKRMREAVDEYLAPPRTESDDAPTSAATVGDMLAGMLGGIDGSGPSTRGSGSRPGGKRAARPKVLLAPVKDEPSEPGWARSTVAFEVQDAPATGARVQVDLRVGVDGGSEDGGDVIRIVGWRGQGPHADFQFLPGMKVEYVYEYRDDLAIDIDARVVAEDA